MDSIPSGFHQNVKLGCQLIRSFSLRARLQEAVNVFNSLHDPNVYAWTAIISAHVDHGQGQQALELFDQMVASSVEPNSYTIVAVLKACACLPSLVQGKIIHSHAIQVAVESVPFVENVLVDVYAKCGSLEDAWRVFIKLTMQNEVSWSTMIVGYVQHGDSLKALDLFDMMLSKGEQPTNITFICVLKACSTSQTLERGRVIHAYIMKLGLQSEPFVGEALVNMYRNCGVLEDACKVFDLLQVQSVIAWSSIISGYVEFGRAKEALELFDRMQTKGIEPNVITFTCLLKACFTLSALEQGKVIHHLILEKRIRVDLPIGSALVSMYAMCSSLEDARSIFDIMNIRNTVTWSAIISGYQEHGHDEMALEAFESMQQEGTQPDKLLFVSIIKACCNLMDLGRGRKIHAYIIEQESESDPYVGSSLVDMYVKCGNLDDGHVVFDRIPAQDVICWSALIAGYVMYGEDEAALELFVRMQKEGLIPNEVTLLSITKACASSGALYRGRLIHADIIEQGFDSSPSVGNSLVDMHAKCGSLDDARKVFDNLSTQTIVSWNAMITGYTETGKGENGLKLFERLLYKEKVVDEVTYLAMAKISSNMAVLEIGKLVHCFVTEQGLETLCILGNTLINMYSNCGSLEDACGVFASMLIWTVVSWNALIAGCAEHGDCMLVKAYFENMRANGVRPDGATFVSLLSGCNHAGLIEEGYYYLDLMRREHGLTPSLQHYICMVDVLGRAGRLYEAERVILNMPFQGSWMVWVAYLGSCERHGYLELGKQALDCATQADVIDAASNVMMPSIYGIKN